MQNFLSCVCQLVYSENGILIYGLKGVDKKLTEAILGKMHSIKIVESIKELNKEEWDAMIGDNVFASYGWLKTVEETYTGNVNPKYFLVQDSNELVGAAVCHVSNKANNVTNLDNILLGRLKNYTSRLGISFLPAFICCPVFCFGKHFLIKKSVNIKKKETIMNELLDTIENKASEHKLSLSFTNIMDNESELIQLLNKRGYNKTSSSPLNYLDIEWSSFSEYVNHLKGISRHIKKNVKTQINKNRKEGVVIERLEKPANYEDRLYELINNNYYKHSLTKFPFKREFFRKLKENLGEDAVIYISVKKNKLTGVQVLFKRNKVGYLPLIGIDHEMAGNDYTYFNMSFYRPIMDAISDETKRLYSGLGMYEMKARRGYRTSDLYIYYKSFNKIKNIGIKPWFIFLSMWYKNKMPKRLKRSRRSDSNVADSSLGKNYGN